MCRNDGIAMQGLSLHQQPMLICSEYSSCMALYEVKVYQGKSNMTPLNGLRVGLAGVSGVDAGHSKIRLKPASRLASASDEAKLSSSIPSCRRHTKGGWSIVD